MAATARPARLAPLPAEASAAKAGATPVGEASKPCDSGATPVCEIPVGDTGDPGATPVGDTPVGGWSMLSIEFVLAMIAVRDLLKPGALSAHMDVVRNFVNAPSEETMRFVALNPAKPHALWFIPEVFRWLRMALGEDDHRLKVIDWAVVEQCCHMWYAAGGSVCFVDPGLCINCDAANPGDGPVFICRECAEYFVHRLRASLRGDPRLNMFRYFRLPLADACRGSVMEEYVQETLANNWQSFCPWCLMGGPLAYGNLLCMYCRPNVSNGAYVGFEGLLKGLEKNDRNQVKQLLRWRYWHVTGWCGGAPECKVCARIEEKPREVCKLCAEHCHAGIMCTVMQGYLGQFVSCRNCCRRAFLHPNGYPAPLCTDCDDDENRLELMRRMANKHLETSNGQGRRKRRKRRKR